MTLPLVSFEQSKALKEAGFNMEATDYFHPEVEGVQNSFKNTPYDYNFGKDCKGMISAPTLALACQWLREIKGLHVFPELDYEVGTWAFDIQDLNCSDNFERGYPFTTHDLALSAGLDKALLILKNIPQSNS